MNHVHLPHRGLFSEYLFPRVRLEVDYVSPLRFGDEMGLETGVERLGKTSYSLIVEVFKVTTGTSSMRARLVIVVLDRGTEKPISVPTRIREALAPYLVITNT